MFSTSFAGSTTVVQGCDFTGSNASGLPAAVAAAAAADFVVLALGIGNGQEHETQDRFNITLPGQQVALALEVLKLGKPTVVVLVSER